MKKQPSIRGVLPVLQMPYGDRGAIDYDTLAHEIDHIIDAGADGVVLALGSELIRLTRDERLELTRRIPEFVAGRRTITISVGADTPEQAVIYAQAAKNAGADAVMALPPDTETPDEEHLFAYYKTIHDAVDIPLVVQNTGGIFGYTLPVGFLARLRHELGDRIYFKPEAQPVGLSLTRLRQALGNEAVVFDGNGGLYMIDTYRRGIDGLMPGCDLIRGTVAIWRALTGGDYERAYRMYLPLAAIVILQTQSMDMYLSIAKYLLFRQGIFRNYKVREPKNHELDPWTMEEIDRLYERFTAALEE